MTRPSLRNLIPLAGLALAASISLGSAVDASTLSAESYHKARAALDAAVEAAGGADRLNSIKTVYLERRGTSWQRNQSTSLAEPFQAFPQHNRMALDLEKGWLMWENGGEFPGGFVFATRTIFRDDVKLNLNLQLETAQPNDQLQIANFEFIHRLFPPLMLRKALQRANTLRWLGEEKLDGRKHDVVSFAWDNGAVYTLYLDARSHTLSKYDLIFPDALTGDAVSELFFPDYHTVDGLKISKGYWQRLAGDKIGELEDVVVRIDQPLDEALFQVPAGFQKIPPAPTDFPKITQLAEKVKLVEGLGGGNYNVLFVEFSDHLVVMEAPLSSGVAAQAIAMIKEEAPGKPIRYLVLSHHHDDHSGGVRAFISEGAKIVTTADTKAYFEKMARGTYTLAADALVREPKKPQFEFVDKKRVFAEGDLRLEIHNLGANPHAENMLIAYLPQHKIVFEADLLAVPRVGPINPANDATVHFAETLAQLGLEIDTLVGVHGTVGSAAHLEEALAKRRGGAATQPVS